MKNLKFLFTSIGLFVLLGLLTVACGNDSSSSASTPPASNSGNNNSSSISLPKYKFNGSGELIQPVNYRRWVYVGTPLTPNELNPPEAAFPEFHNVYIHPDDFEYWEKNGKWQDGTILVKELVTVGKKQHVSGKGYFQGEFIGLEATIKDKKRFPNEPGNWAYFSFGHEYPLTKTADAFPTGACNSCHAASAADDFVFTQDYPVLRAAKNSKNTSIGYLENGSSQMEIGKEINETEQNALADFLTKID